MAEREWQSCERGSVALAVNIYDGFEQGSIAEIQKAFDEMVPLLEQLQENLRMCDEAYSMFPRVMYLINNMQMVVMLQTFTKAVSLHD